MVERICGYPGCDVDLSARALSARYCSGAHRTAHWKLRKAVASGSVYVTFDGCTFTDQSRVGDAQNGGDGAHSARAVELRELRRHGPVPSDRRVQFSRAVEEFAQTLVDMGLCTEPHARYYARVTAERALPARFRA